MTTTPPTSRRSGITAIALATLLATLLPGCAGTPPTVVPRASLAYYSPSGLMAIRDEWRGWPWPGHPDYNGWSDYDRTLLEWMVEQGAMDPVTTVLMIRGENIQGASPLYMRWMWGPPTRQRESASPLGRRMVQEWEYPLGTSLRYAQAEFVNNQLTWWHAEER